MAIVGQHRFRKELMGTIRNDGSLSSFIVIVGRGKEQIELLLREFAKVANYEFAMVGHKVDEVRNVIDIAYGQVNKIMYVIAESDKMSIGAKNAMLKVTEEPPNHATFVMVTENVGDLLPTIRSRATLFILQDYQRKDLVAYATEKDANLDVDDLYYIGTLAETPSDVDMILGIEDIKSFGVFADSVTRNVGNVKISNFVKIAQKLSLKEGDGKYDIALFMRAVRTAFYYNMNVGKKSKDELYAIFDSITFTNEALRLMANPSISKSLTLDNWLIGLWEVWNNDNR